MGVRTNTGSRKRALWVFGFTAWGAALAFGFAASMRWELRAGRPALAPTVDTKPAPKCWLVVALHSQCPCSIATIQNLVELSPAERAHLRMTLLFTGPDPQHSAVLSKAESLHNAEKQFISEGQVLSSYGARTSGQALLYNTSGHLVFSGGLTNVRGVPGDSSGMEAIRQTLAGRRCIATAPVFGCALQTPEVKS